MIPKQEEEEKNFTKSDAMVLGTRGSGPGPRNKDGLLIPTTKSFGILVTIYKIVVILTFISLILLVVGMIILDSLVKRTEEGNPDEDSEAGKIVTLIRSLMPTLITVVILNAIHSLVAWTGIKTLRIRFMVSDFLIQVFFSGIWSGTMFLGQPGISMFACLIVQVLKAVLIFTIIWEMRNANN